MKTTKTFGLLLAFVVLPITYVHGQNILSDSTLYAAAYEYIKNDSIGKLYSIMPSAKLMRTSYAATLHDDSGIKTDIDSLNVVTESDMNRVATRDLWTKATTRDLAWSLKLEDFDKKSLNSRPDTLNYCFPPTYNNDIKADTVTLHFSKVFWHELFAEIKNSERGFGCDHLYFFKFKPDGTIKTVVYWLVQY